MKISRSSQKVEKLAKKGSRINAFKVLKQRHGLSKLPPLNNKSKVSKLSKVIDKN